MGGAHDSRSLDNSAIRRAATTGCLRVTDAIDDARIDRRQTIDAGNAAIAELVATVEAVGAATLDDDPPASDWLNDWRRLAEARAEFADNLTNVETEPFVAPATDGGSPITERMADVAPTECERAVQLAAAP
jgi:hypothetical protein